MRREYTFGDLYTLGRPLDLVRFVKVLGAGPTSVWVRPFARPPRFRWDLRAGVPTLMVEPDPDDEAAGPGVRVVEIPMNELESSIPQFFARSAAPSEELEALNEAVLARDLGNQLRTAKPADERGALDRR